MVGRFYLLSYKVDKTALLALNLRSPLLGVAFRAKVHAKFNEPVSIVSKIFLCKCRFFEWFLLEYDLVCHLFSLPFSKVHMSQFQRRLLIFTLCFLGSGQVLFAQVFEQDRNRLRNSRRILLRNWQLGTPIRTNVYHFSFSVRDYQKSFAELQTAASVALWNAYVDGTDEAFADAAAKSLAFSKFHSDPQKYQGLKRIRETSAFEKLTPIERRMFEKAFLMFEQNQLSDELLEKMTSMSSEIEQIFQNFRGELDGKAYSNNELLDRLREGTDSDDRRKTWDALKQVGEEVSQKLIELAKVRNEAAQKLGYKNYWEMTVHFQEYKPESLLEIFAELDRLTKPLFTEMKEEMDAELKSRFGVETLKPWHYDNPFFQQPPPSSEVNPCEFYEQKQREEIAEISARYFAEIGLSVEEILKKSDLYERENKCQHAFSFDIDANRDVRILCNLKPTDEWMDTQLHELGHAVYSYYNDLGLPHNIRTPAHAFTTEGVAMFFGAKARSPEWLIDYAGTDPQQVQNVADALQKQRRKEQLIFARWTLVMLYFEKAFYENPNADLNSLWWDMVEKYQLLSRPENRDKADWASKPHFVIAPVYYHNYQLGELYAAQLRQSLGTLATAKTPELGKRLKEKVFLPGASLKWEDFVVFSTGEPLSPKAFAEELE